MTRRIHSLVVVYLLIAGCATQLKEAPEQEEVIADALPETTEVPAEWAAPKDDTGQVDDGWLAQRIDLHLALGGSFSDAGS